MLMTLACKHRRTVTKRTRSTWRCTTSASSPTSTGPGGRKDLPGCASWPCDDARPWSPAAAATRTSTMVGPPRPTDVDHWRAGCEETCTPRSGRDRRNRTPFHGHLAGGRPHTNSWLNDYGRLRRCTERRTPCVEAYLALAAAIVTLRALLRAAWTRFRWDDRPDHHASADLLADALNGGQELSDAVPERLTRHRSAATPPSCCCSTPTGIPSG
jgi:hypothetical protein